MSPPSRWCGLKYVIRTLCAHCKGSPPSRWCGLKLLLANNNTSLLPSPPSRWCGLKFHIVLRIAGTDLSPPSRWCGLKSLPDNNGAWHSPVTTFAVVWIEISQDISGELHLHGSPPSRWCGLKSISVYQPSDRPFCHHLRGGVD